MAAATAMPATTLRSFIALASDVQRYVVVPHARQRRDLNTAAPNHLVRSRRNGAVIANSREA
jgi:hypothetical protein